MKRQNPDKQGVQQGAKLRGPNQRQKEPKRFPIYSSLLRLYPKSYREQYGDQILQVTADMLDAAPNNRAKLAAWAQIAADMPANITKAQLQYIGGTMQRSTPHYVKRNSLLAASLLMPFMLALAVNATDKIINNRTLYASWLWSAPVLRLWVLWLPVLAFLLILGTYAAYVARKDNKKTSLWVRLVDIPRIWPVILPGVIALGIVFMVAFHDSGQCWAHTPAYLVSHAGQQWQCTVKNQSLGAFKHAL